MHCAPILTIPCLHVRQIPDLPAMFPPDGKSGPGIISIISSMERVGLSISEHTASISSVRLCGGIFVAIPTAIPVDPFISKLGKEEGSTVAPWALLVIRGEVYCIFVYIFEQFFRNFVNLHSVYL